AHLQPQGWPDVLHPPQQLIRRLLKKLYDLLISPAIPLLPSSAGHLTIVPYGPLHQLPFHALYDGSRFLIEDFQINYLPASSLLTQFNARGSEQAIHVEGMLSETGLLKDASTMASKPPLIFGYSGHGHLQHALEE